MHVPVSMVLEDVSHGALGVWVKNELAGKMLSGSRIHQPALGNPLRVAVVVPVRRTGKDRLPWS